MYRGYPHTAENERIQSTILIRVPLIASSMMSRHSSHPSVEREREITSGELTCDLYVDLILPVPDASAAAAAPAPDAAVVAGHALPRARSDASGLWAVLRRTRERERGAGAIGQRLSVGAPHGGGRLEKRCTFLAAAACA